MEIKDKLLCDEFDFKENFVNLQLNRGVKI